MNFLAHCLLAQHAADSHILEGATPLQWRSGLLAGAVVGDFCKGRIPGHWSAPLQHGVALHRRIDAVSNRLPSMQASYAHFPEVMRRFAPIYLDIIADHLLARHWDTFSTLSIDTFCADCYIALDDHAQDQPEPARRFVPHLIEHNLLAGYAGTAGMTRAVASVARRLGRTEDTEAVLATLSRFHDALLGDMHHYFPELVDAVASWAEAHPDTRRNLSAAQ